MAVTGSLITGADRSNTFRPQSNANRLSFAPVSQNTGEGAQQKVPATAGRIDHLEFFKAEFHDGRFQRAFEDELFHKDRRVEQGVLLAGGLGEVLVKVPQEAGVPLVIREVMDDLAGADGVELLKELDELLAASPDSQSR